MKKLLLFIISTIAMALSAYAEGNRTSSAPSGQNNPCDHHQHIFSQDGKTVLLPDLMTETVCADNHSFKEAKYDRRQKIRAKNTEEIVFASIVLTEAGTLADVLADNCFEIDSISVEGPINEDDFNTLRVLSLNGQLKIINLENAGIEGNIVPAYAFFNVEEQYDSETQMVTTLALEKVILPEGITEIGRAAFAYVIEMSSINFPASLKELGSSSFSDCISLTSDQLTLPEGLERIELQAFYQCRGLSESVIIPSTVTWIDSGAFYMCPIEEINLPETLEYLGCFAFYGTCLKKIYIPDGCEFCEDGRLFYGCRYLEEARMPNDLLHMPIDTFYGCPSLKTTNIPVELLSIGENAYHFTDLSHIDLPSNLECIGAEAFLHNSLEDIVCRAPIPPRLYIESNGNTPFGKIDNSIPIYVPLGTADLYRNARGWSYFNNFIETDDFPTSGIADIELAGEDGSATIYDLNGRVVTTPTPGNIYIRTGQKFIFFE